MSANHKATLAGHIRTYIRAKDENRPHLMRRAFAEEATLEMVVRTSAIAFPPVTRGCAAIADVLVRDFAKQYENVYTFCLDDPPSADSLCFKCGWLVVMSEKDSRKLRMGHGYYDWSWNPNVSPLVDRIAISLPGKRRRSRLRLGIEPSISLVPGGPDWQSATDCRGTSSGSPAGGARLPLVGPYVRALLCWLGEGAARRLPIG
jgi:hypothetical protein